MLFSPIQLAQALFNGDYSPASVLYPVAYVNLISCAVLATPTLYETITTTAPRLYASLYASYKRNINPDLDDDVAYLIKRRVIREEDIHDSMYCAIGLHVMEDPVYFKDNPRNVFDRSVIERYLKDNSIDPFRVIKGPVSAKDLVPATALKDNIKYFVAQAKLKAKKLDNKFEEAKQRFLEKREERKEEKKKKNKKHAVRR